jgi:hypothetical protein
MVKVPFEHPLNCPEEAFGKSPLMSFRALGSAELWRLPKEVRPESRCFPLVPGWGRLLEVDRVDRPEI